MTFTGTVTNDTISPIRIQQPNGTVVPRTGPVPAFPFPVGTPVTVGFNATLPTAAYYNSPAFTGQQAADGIYRIEVLSRCT